MRSRLTMLGALVTRLISGAQLGGSTLNTVVAPGSILLAVLFSAGVGLSSADTRPIAPLV